MSNIQNNQINFDFKLHGYRCILIYGFYLFGKCYKFQYAVIINIKKSSYITKYQHNFISSGKDLKRHEQYMLKFLNQSCMIKSFMNISQHQPTQDKQDINHMEQIMEEIRNENQLQSNRNIPQKDKQNLPNIFYINNQAPNQINKQGEQQSEHIIQSPNLQLDLARLNPNDEDGNEFNMRERLFEKKQNSSSQRESNKHSPEKKEKIISKWKHLQGQKKGRFSLQQQKVLSNAVGQFLADHQITYDEFVIILNQNNIINNILKSHNFFNNLSTLLPNRSAYSCYRFIRRTFNKDNRKGRWTIDEQARLLRLVQKYGRQWKAIGKEMGRTSDNVYDKYRSIGSDNAKKRKRCNWSLYQMVQLLSHINTRSPINFLNKNIYNELDDETAHNIHDHIDHLKASYNSQRFKFHNFDVILKYILPSIKQIPLDLIRWSTISKVLKTRSLIDCKNKFLQIMEMYFKGFQVKHQSIILFIEGQNVSEESQIDWQKWQGVLFHYQQAKNRFFFLKKIVSDKSHKTFATLMNQLKNKMKRNGLY